MKRGQGAFEYVLLLGGVLLIVVLAVVLLRGGIFQSGGQTVSKQNCQSALAQSTGCYYTNGTWQHGGEVAPAPAACVQYQASYPDDVEDALGCDDLVPSAGFTFAWVSPNWCCGNKPA